MKGALRMALHAALAVVGGYAFSAAWSAALAALLAWWGILPRAEAVVLCGMLGFVAYLGVLLWAVSERRLVRLAGILSAGVLCGVALSTWLSPLLANGKAGS
jgi:hypothetical protein